MTTQERLRAEAEDRARPRHAFAQVFVTLALLVAASGLGYTWRRATLEPSAAPGASEPLGGESGLGDLAAFRAIAADTLALVNQDKLAAAKERIADLEYEWDAAEARLKPRSKASWVEVDDAIDAALRELRSAHPGVERCRDSLEALLPLL